MKKILIVAATEMETEALREQTQAIGQDLTPVYKLGDVILDFVHTGIGMVNTGYALGKYFARHQSDLAINIGIAGMIGDDIRPGEVVEIVEDQYFEIGAESGDGFLDLEEMGFPLIGGEEPVYNRLVNPASWETGVRKVKGITVNKVHGTEKSAVRLEKEYDGFAETMEGAAFFHCCLIERVPFVALRGISNRVAVRDRDNWKIRDALKAVHQTTTDFLSHY